MEIIFCEGVKAAGISAGIKKNGDKDLGLVYSEAPANIAGVFTKNKVIAAPLILDQKRIQSGLGRAIVVNSGNANCCTGAAGIRNAERMASAAARELSIPEDAVYVASTGVIGQPLSVEKIEAKMPELVKSLRSGGVEDFARSMMTTDTFPKIVSKEGVIDGKPFTVTGVAKGSGMIHPDMATMLAFVCTDAEASSETLKKTLTCSNELSFNRITVDGDTSTNDMVLLMANGVSGVKLETPDHVETFQGVLNEVMITLALMIVKDGEGATKSITIDVTGAESVADAGRIAQTVAGSNLVKTAFFGEDANWGRIAGAVGRAGAVVDPDTIDIYFDEVKMVENGMGLGEAAEAEATKVLKKKEFTVKIDLKIGDGAAVMYTCDFSLDYVRINADYRS